MGICFQGKLYIGCISNLLDTFPYLAYLNSRRFILQGCGSGWIGRIRIRKLKKLGSGISLITQIHDELFLHLQTTITLKKWNNLFN